MLTVTVGRTNKQINSTSQQLVDSTDLSCRLKEPTSMQSPVFIVQGLNKMTLYNYCKFENRYYWVDDVIYVTTDIQEIHCHLDPLATFKDAIGNSYAYVTFGPSGSKNTWVDDVRFGPDWKLGASSGVSGTELHHELDIGMTNVIGNWTVVIQTQYAIDYQSSGVAYYAFSINDFFQFLDGFADAIDNDMSALSTIQDITYYIGQAILTGGALAMDNIRSAIIMPVEIQKYIDSGAVVVTEMCLGTVRWTVTGMTVYRVPPICVWQDNGDFGLNRGAISTLPNGTYHWLNSPKYCTIEVSHPCGFVDINETSLMANTKVWWYSELSLTSGDYSIRFTSEQGTENDTVSMIAGNLAMDAMGLVPNGYSMGAQPMNVGMSLASMGLSGALGGSSYAKTDTTINKNLSTPAADAEGNPTRYRVNDRGTVTKTKTEYGTDGISGNFHPGSTYAPTRQVSFGGGVIGIFALPHGKISVDIEYYYPGIFNPGVDMDSGYTAYCDLYGYPVNRYLKIGNLSGYIECAGASVQACLGASESNKATINSFMNHGFYYE